MEANRVNKKIVKKILFFLSLFLIFSSKYAISDSHAWLIVDLPNTHPVLDSLFQTDIKISSWNGTPGAVDFKITYDTLVLQIVNFEFDTNSPFLNNCYIDSAGYPDSLHICAYQLDYHQDWDSLFTIGTITWNVLDVSDSTTNIIISVADLVDYEWNPVEVYAFGLHINFFIPFTRSLQNITVYSGQDTCYDATQTIIVAGNGNSFIVQNGGSCTLIAGKKIEFLPGAKVYPGGYLNAYIATTGQYCYLTENIIVGNIQIEYDQYEFILYNHSGERFFKIYPNPTKEKFTLEFISDEEYLNAKIRLYNMYGGLLFQQEISGILKKEFSLVGKPVGMYIIHVIQGNRMGTVKIVKQ